MISIYISSIPCCDDTNSFLFAPHFSGGGIKNNHQQKKKDKPTSFGILTSIFYLETQQKFPII